MSCNPIYDAIHDEALKLLNSGFDLPETVTLDMEDFRWLVALGLVKAKSGARIPVTVTSVCVHVQDVPIIIRSEMDPETWTTPTVH